MTVNVSIYYKDAILITAKLREPVDEFNQGLIIAASNPCQIIEVTDDAWIPWVGATWTGKGFIQGDAPQQVILENKNDGSKRLFAFVVESTCVYRHDIDAVEDEVLAKAYLDGVTFTVTQIDDDPKREVKPWDLLNPNTNFAPEEKAKARLEICKKCPELIKLTSQCKKCGCFMHLKTKLEDATCPIGKW